ncbi:tetratricopeptide repeat protein, partial [Streptomyces sp. NPDC001795]|uniref:tetratricopeptide repeat protein n=1 Tax=Streptomyces sp. NPDC001795 TaxID=3154525 RepID=UPI00331ECAAA
MGDAHRESDGPVSNRISDGVFFQAVIQGRDITVQLPHTIDRALSGLPDRSPTFTGRDEQLKELLTALDPAQGPGEPALVAVAGLPGVGKTELAVQTAERARQQPGWFPGGILFIDLFGYDNERRMSAESALDRLLRALGIRAEDIPAESQDRSRLYRSVLAALAEEGRRILIVIDNASSAEQVRPLLPTDGTTATLLTSRHTLDVGARLYDLDILEPAASIELLRQAIQHARDTTDTRVEDAPEDAATIAHLCAGLPLALRIAAALLFETSTRPLASLAQALQAEHTRLNRLRREDRAVRATFDLSYQCLEEQHARLFRLLPLNAGPDVSTESAAHLAGLDETETETLLADLARAHLVEAGHTWGRWRLHDLIRLYADERGHAHAEADQRDTALLRLLDHYRSIARAADSHLKSQPANASRRFSDRRQALAWLDDERLNLVATVTAAASLGHPKASTSLAFALARFLDYRRHFDDSITVNTIALAACRELGDRCCEGTALTNLGAALQQVRRSDEAIDMLTQAAAICQELGNRRGEAAALNNLGTTLEKLRRFDEAIDVLTHATAIHREVGNRRDEAGSLNNLGVTLANVRRFDEAIDMLTQAATICRELGNRRGEAAALNNLGTTLEKLRRFDEAIDVFAQAAAIGRDLEDRHREVAALHNLGRVLAEVRRFDEAVDIHNQTATAFRELGDRHSE